MLTASVVAGGWRAAWGRLGRTLFGCTRQGGARSVFAGLAAWAAVWVVAAGTVGIAAAGPTYYVDFAAAQPGDGTRERPFNTLRPFLFPAWRVASGDEVDGVEVVSGTTLRLRGRGDAFSSGLQIDRVNDITVTSWEDGAAWELAGFAELARFPMRTSAQRGDKHHDVFSFDLDAYERELRDVRGFGQVGVGAVMRGYRPELPEPAGVKRPAWRGNFDYRIGDVVEAASRPGMLFRVRTPGRSGAVEPAWPLRGGDALADGTAAWEAHLDGVQSVTARDVFALEVPGGPAALVAAGGVGGYSYDAERRLLHVRTPTRRAPGQDGEPAWQVRLYGRGTPRSGTQLANGPLLDLFIVDGATVERGRLLVNTGGTGFSPRTLQLAGATNSTVRDMYIAYSGDDSIAVVLGDIRNVTVERCSIVAPGNDTGIVVFTNGDTDGTPNGVRDVRVRDCDAHQTRPTRIGGGFADLGRQGSSSSFACHIGDGARLVEDVEWFRCRSIGYGHSIDDRTSMFAFSPRDLAPPSGPIGEVASYGSRFIECVALLSLRPPNMQGAFDRTLLTLSDAGNGFGVTSGSGTLFNACVLRAETPPNINSFWVGGPLVLRNTLVSVPVQAGQAFFGYDPAAGNDARVLVDRVVLENRAATGSGSGTGPGVGALSSRLLSRDPPANGAFAALDGSADVTAWLAGVGNYRTPENPGVVLGNGVAEVINLDAPGVNPATGSSDPPAGSPSFLEGRPGAWVVTDVPGYPDGPWNAVADAEPGVEALVRSVVAGAPGAGLGINGLGDTGLFGPYQFGAALACGPADVATPHGVVDADDLLAFLSMLGTGAAGADVAEPRGTPDFFDLLAYLGLHATGCGGG